MDQLLFKYGMIIVAVAVFGLLVAFAGKAIKGSIILEDKHQKYEGGNRTSIAYFNKLCTYCISDDKNKDCYIVDYIAKEDIVQADLDKGFKNNKMVFTSDLNAGKYTLKITNRAGVCIINEIKGLMPPRNDACTSVPCDQLDTQFYQGFRQLCRAEFSIC